MGTLLCMGVDTLILDRFGKYLLFSCSYMCMIIDFIRKGNVPNRYYYNKKWNYLNF